MYSGGILYSCPTALAALVVMHLAASHGAVSITNSKASGHQARAVGWHSVSGFGEDRKWLTCRTSPMHSDGLESVQGHLRTLVAHVSACERLPAAAQAEGLSGEGPELLLEAWLEHGMQQCPGCSS